MKANEFVKKFGWGEAKVALIYCKCVPNGDLFYKNIDVSILELKRLVESHELVGDYCGLGRAKEHAESDYTAPELKAALKQAIADVESCQ